MPVAFSTNLPALGDNALDLQNALEAATDGRVRLQVFEPGMLVPPFQIVDAVHADKIQAGYTWLGYDQGKLPASVLFGAVPFGLEPIGFATWWFEGGGRELAHEIYEPLGVRPILCGLIGPETAGWFREEIVTLKDIEGLKIRFAGLGGKVMQRLGASVTMLPGGEIFQALEKGAIDATEFSLPVVDERLGFDRVARYNYFPGWHQPFSAFHLVVNQRRFDALAPADRALIETTCTAAVLRNLARAEAIQGPVLEAQAAKGVHLRELPADVQDELRRVTGQVLAEEAAADRDFARVLESQRAFAVDHDRWRMLAYPKRGSASHADEATR
jgi:TRAP-type mannitol/chloroaromatic compound transport system substrate-binding protein